MEGAGGIAEFLQLVSGATGLYPGKEDEGQTPLLLKAQGLLLPKLFRLNNG